MMLSGFEDTVDHDTQMAINVEDIFTLAVSTLTLSCPNRKDIMTTLLREMIQELTDLEFIKLIYKFAGDESAAHFIISLHRDNIRISEYTKSPSWVKRWLSK